MYKDVNLSSSRHNSQHQQDRYRSSAMIALMEMNTKLFHLDYSRSHSQVSIVTSLNIHTQRYIRRSCLYYIQPQRLLNTIKFNSIKISSTTTAFVYLVTGITHCIYIIYVYTLAGITFCLFSYIYNSRHPSSRNEIFQLFSQLTLA